MESIRLSFLLFCVLIMAAGAATPTFAQAQKKATIQGKIAVLRMDVITRKSAVVKDVRTQLDTYRNSFRSDIQKEEEALRNANQELARQRTILAPDAFAAERRKFEQRVVDYQRLAQKRKRALDKVRAGAMLKVENAIKKVVTAVAKKERIMLILRSEQTVFWAPPLDITDIVLKGLNKNLPSLKVAAPGK
jgi:outer membrane protein